LINLIDYRGYRLLSENVFGHVVDNKNTSNISCSIDCHQWHWSH